MPKPNGSKEPRMQLMTVSPTQAARWLGVHDALSTTEEKHNRPRSSPIVDRYVKDIKAKNWKTTHEAICFDWNGHLIDGQHRLAAIVKAEMPVDCWVGFDFDPACKYFCDAGRARTMHDVLSIKRGPVVIRGVCAIARAMMDPMRKSVMSRHDQVVFYESHAMAIHWAYGLFHDMPLRELRHSYLIAVVARAYYTRDREMTQKFVGIMRDPVGAMAADRAAIVMRDDVMKFRDATKMRRGADTNRRWLYKRGEYLLDAFLNRNHKPSKDMVVTSEKFPIPGDKDYKSPIKIAAA